MPRRRLNPLRWKQIPLLILLVSLGLTAFGASIALRELHARDAIRFRKSVDQIESTLDHQVDTYVALLRGTAGLFSADPLTTRAQFAAFVARLDLRQRYPGMQAICYVPALGPANEQSFVERLRRESPSFVIFPEGASHERFPVAYVEPTDRGNARAIGFDLSSEPVRRDALESARDRATPVASGKVVLIQDATPGKQTGFIIFLPLYRGGDIPTTIDDRRKALVGFVTAPFRSSDLISNILKGLDTPIDFQIYDGERVSAPALMYDSSISSAATTDHAPSAAPAYESIQAFEICGHRWAIHFQSRPEMLASRGLVALVLLGGIMSSALLFLASWFLARARERAEDAAAGLRVSEHALKRGEERLRFVADASSVLGTSLEYERTLANVASLAVPGFADWSAVDVVRPDGSLERLAVATIGPAGLELARKLERHFPQKPDEPPASVIASGEPLLLSEIPDARLVSAARDEAHLATLRGLGLRSLIVVPLLSRGRVLGALSFLTAGPSTTARRYDQADLSVAEDVARRSGSAIDHARLFRETSDLVEAEKRARAEVERASAALSEHAAELSRSNSELEQFAYVASHDLQEPLRMITNYVDLLRRRYPDRFEGTAAEYMAQVYGGAKRMQELIKDLLMFSRAGRDTGHSIEEIDADSVLDEALANLKRSIDESGAAIVRGTLPRVAFDRMQLMQLFQNLISNALKFRGGVTPRVEVGAARVGDAWQFSVRDNGIGIDPAQSQRIFEVFQRLHTREEYPGTGIGLAICRKIVDRHGGRIWVESTSGAGATFTFTIPTAPSASPRRAGDSVRRGSRSSSGPSSGLERAVS